MPRRVSSESCTSLASLKDIFSVGVMNPPLPDVAQGSGVSLWALQGRKVLWLQNSFNCRALLGPWLGCGCWGQPGSRWVGAVLELGEGRFPSGGAGKSGVGEAVPGEVREGAPLSFSGMEMVMVLVGKPQQQKCSWKWDLGWKMFIFEGF